MTLVANGSKCVLTALFTLIFTVSAFSATDISKIDPLLQREMANFNLRSKSGEAVEKQDLRIIVHMNNAGRASFATVRSEDARSIVAENVANAQNEFLTTLRNSGLLADQGARGAGRAQESSLKIVMMMDYQYAVVGTVSDTATIESLAAMPDVRLIEYDKLNKLFTVEGRGLVGSDTAEAAGYGGGNVGVAVIDSQFDLLHPELGGSTSLPNGIVYDGNNFSDPGVTIHSQSFNNCYHGTGTASIVKRYAPDSDIYALTVFPNAYDSVIADAINWCVTNKNGSNGGAPIKVISMSLGGGQYSGTCDSGLMHDAAGTALSNGILVFAASGNDGWTSSMGSPACSSNVISIGSVWDENNANYTPFGPANCSDSNRQVNERTCYSDTSSVLDLYAPSEEVICAQCGGGTWALGGTSSACPAAAGMTAQFLSAASSYAGDKSGLVSLYQSTGVQVIGDTSKRRIDLMAAINSATGGGGGGGSSTLEDGVTQNLTVAGGATETYTISIPANASNLVVTLTGSGDLDLYVKDSAINWPSEQGSHNTSTFKAPYASGSSESVTFPSPAQGTWHVLVHGYQAGSGTITASWDVSGGGGGGTPQWNYVTLVEQTPHNYGNNKTYEFTYQKAGASQVAVHFTTLNTEANYDFLRVYDENNTLVYTEDGNLISGGSGSAFGRTDGWLVVSGTKIRVVLTTDGSVTRYGYLTDQAGYYQ